MSARRIKQIAEEYTDAVRKERPEVLGFKSETALDEIRLSSAVTADIIVSLIRRGWLQAGPNWENERD